MSNSLPIHCPWPGPRPYEPTEAELFSGRERDILRLLHVARLQRLSILLGQSGVGKTSLIQAGFIPALTHGFSQGNRALDGTGVILRNWSSGSENSASLMFADRLQEALSNQLASSEVSQHDVASWSSPQDRIDATVQYVKVLADNTPGLVIVLDQAEEFLGSGLYERQIGREAEVVKLLTALYRASLECHIMVSMREEYSARLAPLGRHVDGLEKRQIPIEPLPQNMAGDAVLHTAAKGKGVLIPDDVKHIVKSKLLEWLAHGGPNTRESHADLLRLQALLLGVFYFAIDREDGPPLTQIDGENYMLFTPDLLEQFEESARSTFFNSDSHRVSNMDLETGRRNKAAVFDLGQHALELHVERAALKLDQTLPQTNRLGTYIIARMAPWLASSDGFKKHIKEAELIAHALEEDLKTLRVQNPLSSTIEQLQLPSETRTLSFASSKPGLGAGSMMMGRPHEIADLLISTSARAIEILQEEAVVKVLDSGPNSICELIHDGFGLALIHWAQSKRRTLQDTTSAIVVRRGQNFQWYPKLIENESLSNLRWLGCELRDLTFQGVNIDHSSLAGCIFHNCTFDACKITSSTLNGAIFIDCTFKNTKLHNCWLESSLIKHGSMEGFELKKCSLQNATFKGGVTLDGTFKIFCSSLRYSQIRRFEGKISEIRLSEVDLSSSLFEGLPEAALGHGVIGRETMSDEYTDPAYGPTSPIL